MLMGFSWKKPVYVTKIPVLKTCWEISILCYFRSSSRSTTSSPRRSYTYWCEWLLSQPARSSSCFKGCKRIRRNTWSTQDLEGIVLTATDRASILYALKEAKEDLRREDILVVYFSGHGTGIEKDGQFIRYLLPSDASSTNIEATGLELDAIQSWFSSLEPTRKVLIIDSCFNGTGKSSLMCCLLLKMKPTICY